MQSLDPVVSWLVSEDVLVLELVQVLQSLHHFLVCGRASFCRLVVTASSAVRAIGGPDSTPGSSLESGATPRLLRFWRAVEFLQVIQHGVVDLAVDLWSYVMRCASDQLSCARASRCLAVAVH